MKISLDWLQEYVSWDDDPQQLAAKLTAAGLNVESIEEFARTFPGVVVARVLEQGKHPGADRLSVCKVDDGSGEPVPVVCGAPNVRAGLTVLFARVGAVLPGGLKIKKSKIRGEVSQGMICSAAELGLDGDAAGIMELETDLPPGTSADKLYGFSDTVLDIEVTPNRPDWLSHIGVAREVAAIYGTKVSVPRTWSAQQKGEGLGIQVRVEDYGDCPRYMAFGAHGIKVGPSPEWMQRRLLAVGSRPINNLVDITNYVLFELGQPLHAFDRDKLSGGQLTVGRAGKKTTVVTLDGVQREVGPDTLLIGDKQGAVALAGVMGLANSEVEEGTTSVLLESAFFNPSLVRTTSRGLGLISESSYRFERGADWEMVERAAQRAMYLIQELAGGEVVKDWVDRQDPDRKPLPALPLRVWQVNRVLGTDISTGEAAQLLQGLGLKVQPMGNAEAQSAGAVNMMVEVPSFRRDLLQEVDLIEEIARTYGLDRIGRPTPFRGSGGGMRGRRETVGNRARAWLVDNGCHEIVTSSFAAADDPDRLRLPQDDPRRTMLAVINPRHGGDTLLRTSLLPSLLEVARRNLNAQAELPLRLFQLNRVYLPAVDHGRTGGREDERLLPAEPAYLQIGLAGLKGDGPAGVPAAFMALKGVLRDLRQALRVDLGLAVEDGEPWLTNGLQMAVTDPSGGKVGAMGMVHPRVLAGWEVEVPVAVAEVAMDALAVDPVPVRYKPFARFPAVRRDLSLLVPEGAVYRELAATVREVGGPLLDRVELFDVYQGRDLPEGHVVYGIRLKFQSAKGNLKGKAVDKAVEKILAGLASSHGIKPRV